jgi:hypothetical protein
MPPPAKGFAPAPAPPSACGTGPPRKMNSRPNWSYSFLFSGSDRISYACEHSLNFSAASGLSLFLSGCHLRAAFLSEGLAGWGQ